MFDPHADKDRLDAMRGRYNRDYSRAKSALSEANLAADRSAIALKFKGKVTAGDVREVTGCVFTALLSWDEKVKNGVELMSRAGFIEVEPLRVSDSVNGAAEFVAQLDSYASRVNATLTGLVSRAEDIMPSGVIPNTYVHHYGGDCHSTEPMVEQCGGSLSFYYPESSVPDDELIPVSVVQWFYPKSVVDNYRRAWDAFDDLDCPDELIESWSRAYERSWYHLDNQAERREMSQRLSEIASEYNAGGDVEGFDEGAKSFVRYY